MDFINAELQELTQAYYDEQVNMVYDEMLDDMFSKYPQWNDAFVYWESK